MCGAERGPSGAKLRAGWTKTNSRNPPEETPSATGNLAKWGKIGRVAKNGRVDKKSKVSKAKIGEPIDQAEQ